jgi:RHS repeat-associated protein
MLKASPWDYPFGLKMDDRSFNDGTTNSLYKFSGKELDEENELNLYWFDPGRALDQQIGRFLTVDPHDYNYHNLSPYVYVGNNPTRFIDPTGMDSTDSQDNDDEQETIIIDGIEVVTGLVDNLLGNGIFTKEEVANSFSIAESDETNNSDSQNEFKLNCGTIEHQRIILTGTPPLIGGGQALKLLEKMKWFRFVRAGPKGMRLQPIGANGRYVGWDKVGIVQRNIPGIIEFNLNFNRARNFQPFIKGVGVAGMTGYGAGFLSNFLY